MPKSRLSERRLSRMVARKRGVDHGDRLVGQDDARLEQQGPRHHDALALAAAQLVRIAAQDLLGTQTHRLQRLLDQSLRLLFESARSNFFTAT